MIENHKLKGVRYIPSPNRSGMINPKFIVMHYTAGNTAYGAIDTLTRRGSNASAHVVVDKDGTITQLVPFNVKAWHAGPSRYKGYSGLNNYSIGIEIVNIGWVRQIGNDRFEDWAGNIYSASDLGYLEAHHHSTVGSGMFYWPRYTPEQLDSVERLTRELIANYGISDIVSHEEIDTRGWKTDPGPTFPMNRFKKLLPDRNLDSEGAYYVTASVLNVRGGPGTDFEVIGKLNRLDRVSVLEIRGDWSRTNEGWVYNAYLQLE